MSSLRNQWKNLLPNSISISRWYTTDIATGRVKLLPRVVFENKHAVVIDKPCGISHHSSGEEDGILQIMRNLQDSDIEMYHGDLFSVHRLDRDTSGLLLFAKTKDAASFFGKQFAEKKVLKYYVAISNMKPKKKMGLVTGDMVPSRRSRQKLTRTQQDPARSRFISKSFDCGLGVDSSPEYAIYSTPSSPSLRAFLIQPLTGKKHQLRVMLKSLGSPALGDELYSTKDSFVNGKSDRCYLHACALQIAMPPSYNNRGESDSNVQLILPPREGKLFSSPGFRSCWDSWIVPNIIELRSAENISMNNNEHDVSRKQFKLLDNTLPTKWC